MPEPRRPQDLEALFHRAAALGSQDREAFLEEHCAGDAALRKQLVALLQQHDHGTKDYLAEQVLDPDAGSEPRPTEPPENIGRYHIRATLGEGGMGTVYQAEQHEPVQREVALKVIKAGMDTHRVVKRFEAERQTLALMDHPGIARIFDGGATESGRPYFVMELVSGQPLTLFCDEHGLDIDERLQLFQRVCEAIQHAHQKGVIHRDLKPSNILVSMQDGEPRPKIIDFGIARATADTGAGQHTHHSEVIGTFDYMSPEQAEPGQASVDSRSDIYALGAILYELLTGARPFGDEALHEKALADVQLILRDKEVTPPSTQISRLQSRAAEQLAAVLRARRSDASAIRRQLQGDLDWIILKALDKDPSRRYSSASELATDVERHLRHEPVLAGPPSRSYRLAKFVRRNRLAVTAAGVVVVALVIGGVGTAMGYMEAKANETKARKNETRALESEGQAKESAREAKASERRAKDKAAEAERQRKAAQENLDNFNLLALRVKVQRATAAANRLAPRWPDKIDAMKRWLAQARPLVAELPELQERLEALHALGDEWTPAQQEHDRLTHPANRKLAEFEARVKQTEETIRNAVITPEKRRQATAAVQAFRQQRAQWIRLMNERTRMRRTCRMPNDSLQFLHDALVQLILDLQAFDRDAAGPILQVEMDIRWARRVRQRTLVRPARVWSEARKAIRASYKYGGLDLQPQVGLIPLGVNPRTGFWEFFHLKSHAPNTPRPKRAADGSLVRPHWRTGMVFVLLPGGTFKMGCQSKDKNGANYDKDQMPGEGPVHEITLAPFFLSKFEMTQGQWSAMTGKEPSGFRAGTRTQETRRGQVGSFYRYDYPVERVSWVDARQALNRYGLELPTEAQWEYACRGGTTTPYHTGTGKLSLRGHANLADQTALNHYPQWQVEEQLQDAYVGTAPVGSFLPNPFDLYDMCGNVQEWCRDAMGYYSRKPRSGDGYRRPIPGVPYRPVVRGGSYGSRAFMARSALHSGNARDTRESFTGLRPARRIH